MDSTKRGARLGKYSLVAEIARGGMGIVYLAQASGLHGFKKLVVVKQLKPELAEDDKFRDMFLDEARLAARLNHRNIVQTIEVDQDGDQYYFVMEYLEGRTLHALSRLKGSKALSTATHIRIICELLAGLHYAHELADFDGRPLNVVHRDVSPRNVIVTYDGQVKVLDFGVAKASNRDQETEAGELKGRVPYMAPEHVTERAIDRRVDIFSVGVLLRETLTGVRTWEGLNEVEILKGLIQKKIPPIPPDAKISDEARAIIEKAMAPERDDRYATANDMRQALERYVNSIDQSGEFSRVGEHLSKEFAEHRARVGALIEEHVATADSKPPTDKIPVLPMSSPDLNPSTGSQPSAPSRSTPGSRPSEPSQPSRAVTPPRLGSQPSMETATATKVLDPDLTARPSAPTPLPATPPASFAPPAPRAGSQAEISLPPPRKKPSAARYVLSGLGFVALVAGLTVAIRSMNDAPGTKLPTPDPTPATFTTGRRPGPTPPPSASVPEEVDLVEVTIRASPPTAQLWIDDAIVGEGPHTAKYKRDSTHMVRATAHGYVTKTEAMKMTATAMMTITLEKEAGAGPVRPPPRAPHPPGAPKPPDPGPGAHPPEL